MGFFLEEIYYILYTWFNRDVTRQSQRGRLADGLRKDKSCDFRLSQAFAYTVVKKGSPASAASE